MENLTQVIQLNKTIKFKFYHEEVINESLIIHQVPREMSDEEEISNSQYVSELLGKRPEQSGIISTELLQANSADEEDLLRMPTALVTLPAHGMIVIGFDSGEIQVYKNVTETGLPEPGPGFRISETNAIRVLKQLQDWDPFIEDSNGIGNKKSVFYAACQGSSEIFLFSVIGEDVKLSWIKFQLPSDKYKISDAVVCPGMSKMICATEQGRLFVFPAEVEPRFDNDRLADEQVEMKHILIVAHEGCVTCVSSNESGTLALTGGQDGKLCLWQWGRDHFFHQVGQMYLTNLPILSASFPTTDDTEIVISLDTYIMCIRIIKKTSQHFVLEQYPAKHIKMPRGGGRVIGANAMHQLASSPYTFMVLRSSKLLEIVGPGSVESVLVGDKHVSCLCVDHQMSTDSDRKAYTAMAYMTPTYQPFVHIWIQQLEAKD